MPYMLRWIWVEDKRITTIINEIEYWKEYKILPNQYCDFLLALYTNGEDIDANIDSKHLERYGHTGRKTSVPMIFQIILLFLLLPFSFLVVYFTEFHIYLQLGILTLFLSYALWSFLYLKQRKIIYYHLGLMISLFLLLLLSISISNLLFNQAFVLNGSIVINFILWLFLSRIYKLRYLLITSILGLIYVILYVIL